MCRFVRFLREAHSSHRPHSPRPHGSPSVRMAFSIAKRFFPDCESGFFPRDRIHVQRSCLKRIFDAHQSLLRMFIKIPFKGLCPWIHPVFLYVVKKNLCDLNRFVRFLAVRRLIWLNRGFLADRRLIWLNRGFLADRRLIWLNRGFLAEGDSKKYHFSHFFSKCTKMNQFRLMNFAYFCNVKKNTAHPFVLSKLFFIFASVTTSCGDLYIF